MVVQVRRAVAPLVLALALLGGAVVPAAPAAASGLTAYDVTSPQERRRVDSVPTPVLVWRVCAKRFRCATVRLPRDYDQPRGDQVEIALVKLPARKPARRVGTLFLNPGGPGGSGIELVHEAPSFLSGSLRDRFDLVGFDPRGIGASDPVRCFSSSSAQAPVLRTFAAIPFPYGSAAERTYRTAERRLGQGCSTTGRPMATSMSTAEVARDLDVLRRAVGDRRLSYLGFSYGTYLGQVYANLFPDRVRALALDAVLDPVGWAGTPATKDLPIEGRIHSAEGAAAALRTALVRCDRAGPDVCSFADGNPVKNFDVVAERLKRQPVVIDGTSTSPPTFGYPELVANVLSALYFTDGPEVVASLMSQLMVTTAAAPGVTTAARRRAGDRLSALLAELRRRDAGSRPGLGYDNGLEAQATVACTDSLNPAHLSSYPAAAAAADRRAKYFGRLWTWSLGACADDSFPGRDPDAYRGPFTRRTFGPLLFLGSYWDPATSYAGAVAAAALSPGSRLVASDSWGHTSYGTSTCATRAVDDYLLTLRRPKAGTVCVGDDQPFPADALRVPAGSRTQRGLAAG